jgi:Concanavalin A-like lectin/glucanases superfamily/Domain of unknown function (DUF2341)
MFTSAISSFSRFQETSRPVMNNEMTKPLLLFCAASLLACLGCSNMALTGGGTEGGNVEQVAGTLMTPGGGVASNAQVALVSGSYNPASAVGPGGIALDTTSEGGVYIFSHIDTGVYNIQAVDLNKRTRVFISDIHLTGRSVRIQADTLEKPGRIRVQLITAADSTGGFVYLPGSTVIDTFSSNSGYVMMDSVPRGMFHSLCYGPRQNPGASTVLAENVQVVPESTTIVSPYEAWSFSKRLYLNTASTGAGVQGNVVHFPVLVRLSGINFNFTQAKSSGEDCRFTKSNGVPLAYEIERWNASQSSAEIWVKVDTVFGNDNSHFIIMYWGNPTATSASSGTAVFDTAQGFQGVWHMGQAGNTTAFDATFNHFDQTPFGMTAASSVSGAVGGAQEFDGKASFFQSIGTASGKLNFPQGGTYAISAWAYADTLDQYYHTIACKGDNQYNLEIIPSDEWEFAEYADGAGWNMTTSHATEKVWTYVTGIRDGSKEYLYVNGAVADSIVLLGTAAFPRNSGFDFMIGRTIKSSSDTTAYFFKGVIDEVRITSVAPSADWIRLCYMNQNAEDKLVIFK